MTRKRTQKKRQDAFGQGRSRRNTHSRKPHKLGREESHKHQMAIKVGRSLRICEDDVIGVIVAQGGEANIQDLLGAFDLGRSHRKILHSLLQFMEQEKTLRLSEEKHYTLREADIYHKAVLSVNPRGFAFAALDHIPSGWQYQDDLFINPDNKGSAMHGDHVLIKMLAHRGDRAEAKVIRVLERGVVRIVGIYQVQGSTAVVTPEDERFPFTIRIRPGDALNAQNGEAVVAVITEQDPGKPGKPKGEIIEVLGDPDSLMVQTEIVIRKFDLPHLFSKETKDQVRTIDTAIIPGPDRTDLRDILHITIDGETARDFDDAVAISKTEKGFRLYVSIADVSHYVTENSALDQEAYQRGTSVYFPTRVLPMLPEELSNDLCSLVPNQDRYAMSAILDFDTKGKLLHKSFAKSIINSRYRMTYNLVSQILIDKDEVVRQQYTPLLPDLALMEKLGHILLKKRMARGSIGFEIPELAIEVTDKDEILTIGRRERNFAHQIIEEFMLAANEAVAQTITENHLAQGLYRIHERPDPQKVDEFSSFAKTMGLKLPDGTGTPEWFGKVILMVAGKPEEYIVNNLLLRTMKQARYSPDNVGHFGLAAEHYTHFTSPIRRFPDLIVHRTLARFLSNKAAASQGVQKQKESQERSKATEAGEFLSKRERVAVDAERELMDRMKVRYMEDKIGEKFAAIISGVSSFGLFVELLDSFINGGISIKDLTDDYYYLEEKSHRLVGKRLHKVYQLGKLVRVRLSSVEKSRRRINFVIDED